jgi:fluoroacetyl-CoA thioesterase
VSISGASVTGGIVIVVSTAPSEPSPAQGLTAGLSARVDLVVTPDDTALVLGSGDVAVLATPRLIALCEEASCVAVRERLGGGRTTVATRIQFDHLAPVERVEGRRLIFTISARRSDEHSGLVGAGRLTRVLVDEAAFLDKAGAALAR